MKRITDLMKIDLIALAPGGKKNGAFIGLIVLLVMCTLYSLYLPPFMALYLPIFAAMAVKIITEREHTAEYGKTFCVVPADRKSVVLARFLMMGAAVTAVSLILYAATRIILLVNPEIIEELIEIFDINTSAVTLTNIAFSAMFASGMWLMSAGLRKYFRYGIVNKKNSLLRTVLKVLLVYIIMMIVVSASSYLMDVPIVWTIFSLLTGIIGALSRPMQGMLLSLTLIIIGFGAAAYQTVCAVIEYDEREL